MAAIDDFRSRAKLFWKNGGWVTLVIISTFLLLFLIAFRVITPVLRSERIQEVRNKVSHLSDIFVKNVSSIETDIWHVILKNEKILSNPDSAAVICSELLRLNPHLSGVSLSYLKHIPNSNGFLFPFVFCGKKTDTVCDLNGLSTERMPHLNQLCSFYEQHPLDLVYFGHYRKFPFCDGPSIPISLPVSSDSTNINAVITAYSKDITTLRNFFSTVNPYPEGLAYMIYTADSLFAMTPFDSLINQPAIPWLREKYGDSLVFRLRSLSEDEIVVFQQGDMTFLTGKIFYNQRILLYAIPTFVFTADLREIAIRLLICCLLGFLLISLVCILAMKKNGRMALRQEVMRKDMENSAEIQMSLLSRENGCSSGVEYDARLIPAKLVGGDLYYCFERDGFLFFCIGDVSGKGMPAALFMSKTISLFKYIVRHAVAADIIAKELNEELCENNDKNMFVTMFIGILELKTGFLRFCNAGHNEPLFLSGNDTSAPEYLRASENLPLGIVADTLFTEETLHLNAGSVLLLYTDGITEAMNEKKKMYGEKRLLDLFSSICSRSSESINSALIESIHAYAGKQEQSDDITLLTLKWKTLDESETFNDNPQTLSRLKPFFDNIAERLSLDIETSAKLRSAVDEAVTNVVKHGFANCSADLVPKITLHAKTEGGKICFTITDNGVPFNPLTYPTPDVKDIPNTDIMDIQIGGLGIPMMKLAFNELLYDRKNGHNILTLTKSI